MHMSDALLSPAVGGAMWVAAGTTMALSAKKAGQGRDSGKVPLMGVLAAFIFAGQMINFTIPGTGSSGHLGGGLILAALLGPSSAFLAMASILAVQALFFADGGLLALGCNIFNLGFFPAFVAYPLVFRPLAGKDPAPGRLSTSSVAAAVTGLLLGALAVVLQTVASGITDLPFRAFASFMLPIHFVIGIVEGLITAAVVTFVWKARPEVLQYASEGKPMGRVPVGGIAAVLVAAAVIAAGGLSWFSSSLPDGLEWSVGKTAGTEKPKSSGGEVHSALRGLQEKTAVLPDYGIPGGSDEKAEGGGLDEGPGPNTGARRSLSGIIGGFLSLLLAIAVGYAFRSRPVDAKGKAAAP